MRFPVIKGTAYVLCHVPDLVRYGSEPMKASGTEAASAQCDAGNRAFSGGGRRRYQDAVAYGPHQVFIGNALPGMLKDLPRPWWQHPLSGAEASGPGGEIMHQEAFYGLLRDVDQFDLIMLEEHFSGLARERLAADHHFLGADLKRIKGCSRGKIVQRVSRGEAAPLHHKGNLVGCIADHSGSDPNLSAPILLENLAAKASGVLALRHLFDREPSGITPTNVDYVLNCGEEAVGDRGQRGGGGLARAIAESAGLLTSTGCDVKAFCCAPVHALVMAACMIQSGLCRLVAVVGGGSLAKLGLHHERFLQHNSPVLEDVLAAFAVLIGASDGKSPQIRLDCVGKQPVGVGSAPAIILEELVMKPLAGLGKKLTEIDLYALELHNPEIMSIAGKGYVAAAQYRLLAAAALNGGHLSPKMLQHFVDEHGSPGFAPIQGHIASAIPLLGCASQLMLKREIKSCLFVGKGSTFLGRMTQLSDGLSFLLECP